MNRIKEVLEGIYSNPELRKSIIPLFIGNPGLSKTVQIEEFAREKGVKLVTLITSQLSPMEVSGLIMPNRDTRTIEYYDSESLLSLRDGDILFLDEILNGSPIVLAAMLTLLASRTMISGKPLPDVTIIAAANPQGMTTLTPQIKERFVWYNIKFHEEMWINFMIKKYGITRSIGEKLSKLIKDETFTSNNFNTPRSLDKAVGMITNEVYTPYETSVRFILEELITKTTEKELTLRNGEILRINESMTWLDVYKKNKIIQ